MCDPDYINIATKVIGTAVKAAVVTTVAVQKSNAKKAEYEYKAKVAKNNAKIAETNAAQERQSGLEEARLQRIKTLQSVGTQQTAMAANGIDVTSGTALDTIEDTATMGELDALMIEYNAERQAQNYEQTAANYKNQANLDYLAAKNAKKEGTLNAWSTAASGVVDVGLSLNSDQISNAWKSIKNSYSNLKSKTGGLYSGGLEKRNYSLG